MSVILCIETATRVCSVALGKDGKLISIRETNDDNSHSSLLTGFIQQIIGEVGIKLSEIDAVAVSKGPGSFTGLRIGVSTAKGLCYALDKPLISINTLQSMALGMALSYKPENKKNVLFCPMIDARRMEVYMAVYDENNSEILAPCAEIITAETFGDYVKNNALVLAGDGAEKCRETLSGIEEILFQKIELPSARHMVTLTENIFLHKQFENLAAFEPYYLKDFIAGIPHVKGL